MGPPGGCQVVEECPGLLVIEGQGRSCDVCFRCAEQANGQLGCGIGHKATSISWSYSTFLFQYSLYSLAGLYPHLGSHLRAFKCDMIQVLLGKLCGCLTPDTCMIPFPVVIGNGLA